MAIFHAALTILLTSILGCQAVYHSDDNNHFTSPVTTGGPLSYASDPVWAVGDKHTISWVTNVTTPYWLSLWQHDPVLASARNLTVLWSTQSAVGNQHIDWIVEVPSNADLNFSNLFLVWINGPDIDIASWAFNITTVAAIVAPSSSASPSSSAAPSSTATIPTTSTSILASTTSTRPNTVSSSAAAAAADSSSIVGMSTISTSSTPSSTALATTDAGASPSSDASSATAKLGLGIGLGIGIPLTLLVVAWLLFSVWKEKRRTRAAQQYSALPYTHGDTSYTQQTELAGTPIYVDKAKGQPNAHVYEMHSDDGTFRGTAELPSHQRAFGDRKMSF